MARVTRRRFVQAGAGLAGLGLLSNYAASSIVAASRPSRNVFHALTDLSRPARLDPPVTVQVGRTGALVEAGLVEMGFPDMIAAFTNRAIDAAVQVDPTAAVAVNRGVAVKWHEAAELSPGVQAAVIVYSPKFAQQTDVADRWMLAYLQGV